MKNKKIAVIGAGPAGIIASAVIGKRGLDVDLYDSNEKIGKKLFITGKGRCNITNNSDISMFFDNIMTNRDFLYSSLYSFTNLDIIKLLGTLKVKTKVERGNRIFPVSNKSSDVIRAFELLLRKNNVNLKLNSKVSNIYYKDNEFYLEKEHLQFKYDSIVIATGGMSYPKTGSVGLGYDFAKKLGHNIIEPKPSLVPIETKETYVKSLQGLSLKNISIRAMYNKKEIYSNFGEMLFTHYGISGPIVLSMSTYLYPYMNNNEDIKFYIDLKPKLSKRELDKRILRDFKDNTNKALKNSLDKLLPLKTIELIIKLSKLDSFKPVHQLTKVERERLVEVIKNFPLTFKKFRPISEAIITSGGVDVNEINPSTMESKLVNGLFFAGEIIDVDALTGGYNLQIAYSTGFLAGNNV